MLDEENTLLGHMCKLNFTQPVSQQRLTTVVGTISKSSRNKDVLKKMIISGMRIARLNFSHETHEHHAETLRLLRISEEECSKEVGYLIKIAVALDTKGSEIRTGLLEAGLNAQIELKATDSVRLTINRDLMDKGNRDCIYVDFENIINVVFPGCFVYINDGSLKLVVKEVGVDCITCQVERGGILGSRKNVNIPGVFLNLPAVSKKDVNDLKFALHHKVDIIFASSMRNASSVNEIRSILGVQGKRVKIIAKIECEQSLHNVDEIITAADGILFANADIAIEIHYAKVFLAQKAVIERCNRAGKPIILATKLLESMRYTNFPTKAEISDLGNAILDGADCVMLSSETAIGPFPIESISYMATICHEAEIALCYRFMFDDLETRHKISLDGVNSVAIAAVDAAKKTSASAIIVLTTSGKSSYLLAKYRPKCPILAVTKCPRTFRQSFLYRGIIPVMYTGSL